MRVITVNLNGIRAAAKKGFFDWLEQQNADVVCIQETKAQADQLTDSIFHPKGYYCYYHDAEKKGYSGVALYSREKPNDVKIGIGWSEVDKEGRYLEACFSNNLNIVSLYMHSGSASDERQAVKFAFMEKFMPYLRELKRSGKEYIICGDWNMVHRQIDIKNWRGNQKNSGCLPEERAWMDELFDSAEFVDAFRVVNQEEQQYTWWSNRGKAWQNNTGWRIDYQIITPGLKDKVVSANIYKDQRFSDHAPLTIDYDLI
jgi:exodeoxyribonuclease-3